MFPFQYTVEASFIEIYNETILDLLTKDPSKANEKLDIRLVQNGAATEIDVPGLTKYMVGSIDEVSPTFGFLLGWMSLDPSPLILGFVSVATVIANRAKQSNVGGHEMQ